MRRRFCVGGAGWVVVAAAMLLGLGSAPVGAQTGTGPSTAVETPKPMVADAHPVFEVATIKPSDPNAKGTSFRIDGRHIRMLNQPVANLIALAYGLQGKQIVGGPAWLGTDRYDIDGVADVEGEPNLKQMQEMYRRLLAERFGMVAHTEKKEVAVYALTVGKAGMKNLAKSKGDPNGEPDQNGGPLGMTFANCSMGDFSLMLGFMMDRPVEDETGIAGRWDFALSWTPQDAETTDANGPPGVFTAIQEQLGLKLEAVKAPVDVIVIDKVERPSAN
jgi:uncharacterized protein (TIGR03435 family)